MFWQKPKRGTHLYLIEEAFLCLINTFYRIIREVKNYAIKHAMAINHEMKSILPMNARLKGSMAIEVSGVLKTFILSIILKESEVILATAKTPLNA